MTVTIVKKAEQKPIISKGFDMLKALTEPKPWPSTVSDTEWLDGWYARVRAKGSANVTVPWLLTVAYLFDHHDIQVVSDDVFERMCEDLLANWSTVEHEFKPVLNRSMLSVQSLNSLTLDRYPDRIRYGARELCKSAWGILIDETRQSKE